MFSAADIELLQTPAVDGSAQPQLSAGTDGRIVLSWLEPDGEETLLRYARFADDGWSTPGTAARGQRFFVNWADVPSVVPVGEEGLAAHWLQYNGQGTYAYGVRVRLAQDDGRSWSDTIVPHDDRSPTEHGFVSIFDHPDGGTGLVWLDGRQMAAEGAAADEGHGTGDMSLRVGLVRADGQVSETLLDPRTCECCPTSAVRTDRGVVVAYRDRSEGEVRDIALVRYEAGAWTAPVVVHPDGWVIEGCPVNGPALAADGDRVVLAWFTAAGGTPKVQAAFSADGGISFGAPIRISDEPSLGRVDVVLLADGSALVTHLSRGATGVVLESRRIAADGVRSGPVVITEMSGNRASGYPRVVRAGRVVLFAWTDASRPSRIRTARVDLP
jgi:hypothetical protein